MGNRELEEAQVNNEVAGRRLKNPQYEASQGNGEYTRERCQEIIERGIPGMRKETSKGGNYNCYGGAEREIAI